MFTLCLSGCPKSQYPLVKAQDSTSLVSPGKYCVEYPSNTTPWFKYCSWVNITGRENKGYSYVIEHDNEKRLTDRDLRYDTTYYVRIVDKSLSKGKYVSWRVFQHCKNNSDCFYMLIRKVDDNIFEVGYVNKSKYFGSKTEIVEFFESTDADLDRRLVLYDKEYLRHRIIKERNEATRKAQKRKELNKGDL